MKNKSQISNLKVQNFLEKVIEKKREDLYSSRKERSDEPRSSKAIVLDFARTIKNARVAIIAEIKFATPTNPHLGSAEDLLDRAKEYERAGADAISVITEKHFFKGDIGFVRQVKEIVNIPILQKDFVIDEQQIYEAKSIGSDALLLIARLVDAKTLKRFVKLCFAEGIEPIVEVYDEKDLQKAVVTKTSFIAVNARGLETFTVDVGKACELLKKIPNKFIKLGFSGIQSATGVQQYANAGARGVLVGTSLMKAKNIGEFIQSLR